ncbi:TonB-dependent receptor plug domain-containing protein [Sandarakinorhabdus rubra]|uniref:TonB-dependent receptor plug domain-containing protein n=1 Tax=Sandarakinorhabdus rubra TaxID=2672568 RepID=UPI0013DB7BBB|nr:TonB-dependent receptor [Sandarakinorhabdus rubra]
MKSMLLLAGSILAGSIATAAVAQEQAAAAAETNEEMVIVTGSRIVRPEIAYSNPVQSLSAATIESSGDVNITEFLLDSPALVGSLSNQRNAGSNGFLGSVGLNLLDLRNLGTQRTLVLVNGRRHVNAYPGENSVDINTIPNDLIERVDILTGGASAVYGADAVTGVVNFVLKRNFEGLRARFQAGISELGDGGNRLGSIVVGKNFADGRGNVTVAYEYSKQDRLNERQRQALGNPSRNFQLLRDPADFPDSPSRFDRALFNNVSWADSAPNGAVDLDFDGLPDFEGGGRVYDRGQPLSGTGGRAINSTSNTPTAGYFGDLQPNLERHNVNILTSYEFSPAVRFYAEGKYVRTNAASLGQPSFDFFTLLADDNAYVNQRFGELAPFGALVSRDNFDMGIREDVASRDTYRAVVGFDGELSSGDRSGNLRYDVSYVYGRADATVKVSDNRVNDRYFAAIDAVVDPRNGQITCRINLPGQTTISGTNAELITDFGLPNYVGAPLSFRPGECVPLNILGQGVRSDAAQQFVFVDDIGSQRSQHHVLTAVLSGDLGFLFSLPGGPIGFAVGAEYRHESTSAVTSAFQQAGYYDGGAQILPSSGSFDVKEVFGEINVPLLADVPFAKNLSFGGAIRYSDYSTVGSTLTWKVDGTYAPIEDIAFRATYSNAVRAPNITELFSPLQGTFEFLDDPCDPTFIAEGTQFRAANCQAALQAAGLTPQQILDFSPATDAQQSTSQPGLVGGNPRLREETAKTWTAGVVLRPRFIPGLSITADWYDIKLTNAINTPDVNEVFKLCVDSPTLDNAFCDSFERAPGTGFIQNFVVSAQNVAAFTTSGLEVSLNYTLRPKWKHGIFNLRMVGGYLNDLTFVATVGGVPEQQRNRTYRPNYVGNLDLTWQNGPLSINYGLAWQGKTQRFTTIQLNAQPDLVDPKYFFYKERWEHDISASFDVDDKFTLYGGVNNFTNQQPDLAANIPVNAIGRFFFIGAKVKLDKLF